MKTALSLLAAVLVLIVLVTTCAIATPPPVATAVSTAVPTKAPEPTNLPAEHQVVVGERAFNNDCSSCHGAGFSKKLLLGYGTACSPPVAMPVVG